MIHGGPQSQYDYRFDYEAQLMAAEGYVVVMPNPRGSWGYGQAFSTAIYQDWGGIDYEDVIASMDHAIDEGWVDAERTGVFGWSYGGMMTNHVITKTNRFKAAITGASATLYMANYGHDQYQRWWEEELGLPWLEENREKWNSISPFFSLDKVNTPTLIVGGEQDWNVPIHNSEQLYIALKRQGVPTELVVYPDQGHIFDVPSYEKDLYERYIKWFGKWLGG
jgi:dipeptidyl aminopeptidase/acylaminoacyl peptidase